MRGCLLLTRLLQKYGVNGDKVGLIVLNDFFAFGSKRNPAFRHSHAAGDHRGGHRAL